MTLIQGIVNANEHLTKGIKCTGIHARSFIWLGFSDLGGVFMTPGWHSPRSEFTQVLSNGSIFVYMISPQISYLARVTPAWVHPDYCTGARISLRYEISQRYHVNTKRAPVSVWNRSARRLERVAHGKCLWLWNTRASDYFESFLLPQLLRGENDSTQSDEIQATIAGLLRWTFSYGL